MHKWLKNSFIKTEAAIFPMQTMLLEAVAFSAG